MGQLTLIRHGQARAFEQDSDRLTEIGEQQARALGAYWLRHNVGFDEAYCGTLVRQRRTAEIIGAGFAADGRAWPALQSLPALNEYDASGLWQQFAPALAERDAQFRVLLEAFQQHRHSPERNRYFQKMFEAATTCWLKGEFEAEGVEHWASFRERVRGALKQIMSKEGSGRRIAVFTSGGVIGLAVQTALHAPEAKALEINWRVRNCSLTEFTFSRDRLAFDSFNALPHLDDPALITYR
ncbi:MAG: histidine phosphatase family protein [Acidobacteria bacterium]|nr:histidine phosphatase family protein [Acidobacteriota bacterium]MBI3425259.1 histidine phosphatase family protein [Acidobacteriota bacterium]